MAFPRSLRCFIILNVIRVIILLDSFHFIYLFFSDRQIGNTTCTDEDQDGKRKKENTFSEICYVRIAQNTACLNPEISISIFFYFSWEDCHTKKKLKTIVLQNFGGANKLYYGQYQIVELTDIDFRGCSFFLGCLTVSVAFKPLRKGSTLETSGTFPLLFNAYFGKR